VQGNLSSSQGSTPAEHQPQRVAEAPNGCSAPGRYSYQESTPRLGQFGRVRAQKPPSPAHQVEGEQDQLREGGVGLILPQPRSTKVERSLPLLEPGFDGLPSMVELDDLCRGELLRLERSQDDAADLPAIGVPAAHGDQSHRIRCEQSGARYGNGFGGKPVLLDFNPVLCRYSVEEVLVGDVAPGVGLDGELIPQFQQALDHFRRAKGAVSSQQNTEGSQVRPILLPVLPESLVHFTEVLNLLLELTLQLLLPAGAALA